MTGVVYTPYDKEDGTIGYRELTSFPIYTVGDGAQFLK